MSILVKRPEEKQHIRQILGKPEIRENFILKIVHAIQSDEKRNDRKRAQKDKKKSRSTLERF